MHTRRTLTHTHTPTTRSKDPAHDSAFFFSLSEASQVACGHATGPGFAFFSFFKRAWSAATMIFPSGRLNLTAPAPEEEVCCMLVLLSTRVLHHSVKTHHVVDLPHVDAFQWKCIPSLLRDLVALKTNTRNEPWSHF